MSYIVFEGGKILFHDANDKKIFLADILTSTENHSRLHSHQFLAAGGIGYPLAEEINKHIKNIYHQTPQSMADVIIFLRIVAEILRKEQPLKILRVGEWSELNSALARFLPTANPENILYSFAKSKPLEQFDKVQFIFAEETEVLLPENKFSAIILDKPLLLMELLLAAKDFGKVFFTASRQTIPQFILDNSSFYDLTENLSLFEFTISPELKNFLRQQTQSGQLAQKKISIKQTVQKFFAVLDKATSLSGREKKFVLDQYISELAAQEKVLNEIFPNLHSDSVKQNFNMLKEFLIDYRLFGQGEDKIFSQHKVLSEDMKSDF